jgi:hypothetical protein
MNFDNRLNKLISVKDITLLKDMDKRIDINKFGKFYCYNCSELDGNTV